MKPLIFSLLLVLAGITWWRLRSRGSRFFRVAVAAYLVIVVVRLAGNGMDQEQLQLAGFSFAFFAALWVVAWFITRRY